MRIDIYTCAQSVGSKDSRRTACGVILVGIAADGRVQVRELSFALGNNTVNLASIQAARIGLLALALHKPRESVSMAMHTDNHYVMDMLRVNNGVYVADPKTNIDAVKLLRQMVTSLSGLSVIYEKYDSGIGKKCLELARAALLAQHDSDSGTKEFPNVAEAGLT